ncbi:BMC domain-containing protein [Sporomusa acidovorans]|uniref:Propanediol utilization protein PduA n=1 Tax=Sporomusa acidovorans (strain ATCC 49682 / DSM 3132 / Mol) TaxID=1123286 RepID=A0ABZ3J906_SPOA4|nr:BMC domain-containing protein [Sporomusa acidovorans]OZC17339.1 propanediol utilization protein PduA [Sporomusa acidovorans DSM 3132]SDF45513.1 Carboxysome shell and ethanolamine utilization microcompartment protein CcmL/EutN [Sporomusa acidovorans]
MFKNALGLIEVVGLTAGMEAADAAVKAANVELIGYELTKGGGMVVIKISGDVGAVQAAIAAAAAAASKVSTVVASHVIPRPGYGLENIIITQETVGAKPSLPQKPAKKQSGNEDEVAGEAEEPSDDTESIPEEKPAGICNICGDPACQRRKGDPKSTCIHYNKGHKEE